MDKHTKEKYLSFGLEKKQQAVFFSIALVCAGVKSHRLRYACEKGWWFIRAPNTHLVMGVWLGFLAGHKNRIGYTLGIDPSKWMKSFLHNA